MRSAEQNEIVPQDRSGEFSLTEKLGVAGQPRSHGAHVTDHGVVFNLWGPTAKSVELLESEQAARRMPREEQGRVAGELVDLPPSETLYTFGNERAFRLSPR